MGNRRITESDIRSLFDAIAIFYFGLLRIDSDNNVFIGESFVGKIEINGVHDNYNLINSWKILSVVINELGDEKYEAFISLMETSGKRLSNRSCEILDLLIKQERD